MVLIGAVVCFILAALLVCVICVTVLLFKYIKIFNSIYDNTNIIKYELRTQRRALTVAEKDALINSFD